MTYHTSINAVMPLRLLDSRTCGVVSASYRNIKDYGTIESDASIFRVDSDSLGPLGFTITDGI
jgi:hypothetical protein